MRLDEVRRVEAIPVLGTGKTDYKLLRRMLRD
jgi:long-chain-fatty-acid--[acyl-carrier-protein] ligase